MDVRTYHSIKVFSYIILALALAAYTFSMDMNPANRVLVVIIAILGFNMIIDTEIELDV